MATVPPNSFLVINFSSVDNATNASCDTLLPPPHQSKLILTIYSVIFVLGSAGNGLVVFVLCQKSSRKTVANTYMLSLALSDLLCVLSLPFWAVYYFFDYDWVFGTFMCKLCGSILPLNLYASIFFITCMSVDRYLAIVHPFSSLCCRSPCRARVVSCIVWAIACLTAVPAMEFRNVHYLESMDVTACVILYPTKKWSFWMALLKNTLGFLLPFIVIASCYCSIGYHLLAGKGLNKSSNNLDRVLRMVVAVVLAFFICWFPFHVVTFLDTLADLNILRFCTVKQMAGILLPFVLCIGFSNSAINPFLYCFVGNHFQQQLRNLYQDRMSSLSQKRGSISTRLSSFSRKLSDLKDLGPLEIVEQHSVL